MLKIIKYEYLVIHITIYQPINRNNKNSSLTSNLNNRIFSTIGRQ